MLTDECSSPKKSIIISAEMNMKADLIITSNKKIPWSIGYKNSCYFEDLYGRFCHNN
jgi:hypothetical protein